MKQLVADLGMSFWRLLPANPIVTRVISTSSKRPRQLSIRVVYLLILFVVLLVQQFGPGGGAGTLSSLAKSSTRIFESISLLQLAMMCLLAPVFTASAISQEKDAETFNVLLTTPLSNAQIVLGSLLSRLFLVLMLLLSGLPIFCITMLFGGVTMREILLSFGIAASTACFTGALAVAISVIRVGTRGTIFSFYVGIAAFLGMGFALGMWPVTYVPESVVPATGAGMSWLAPFHPFLALAAALNSSMIRVVPPDMSAVARYPWPVDVMLANPAGAYMVMTLLSSVVMVAVATVLLRRGIKQGEVSFWSRMVARIIPSRRTGERSKRARRVWANPVAWREAVTRANAASSNMVRYGYAAAGAVLGLVLLIYYLQTPGSGPTVLPALQGLVLIEFMIVLLMAANTAATAITRERDSETLDLLLTTPLTSEYILWGKVRGLISFAVPLMIVPAATVLAFALIDAVRGPKTGPIVPLISALLLPFLLAVYAALVCILGLNMSLKNRRSMQAVLATVGLLVVLGFGLGMCGMAALSMGPVGPVMIPITFVTSVYFLIEPAALKDAIGGGMRTVDIQIMLAVGCLIAVALYTGIIVGLYRSMKRQFDMIVRKQAR